MGFLARIFLFLLIPACVIGQSFSFELSADYENYKEPTIKNRRFKHSDIIPLIQKLERPFEVRKIGDSMEGKAIYLVKIGRGSTKVLLWSQMHGDESTATMALLDIFNFFSKSDQFDYWRKDILDNLTLYFIPMLNPDGADRFRRRNALNIDLNRDALRLQTPEAQLLKKVRDQTNANWGFNLHDQSSYYSVGNTNKTATISFLAPTFNYEKDINPVRKRAMQQIGLMNETLQQFMPGHVAKYNDDFEPRAFGDNIQKWGTSTILIESGGYKGDPEKQFIRKMNYIALMTAFDQIAAGKYAQNGLEGYESIPFNGRYFHDLVIRNATVFKNGQAYIIDVAFRKNERSFGEGRNFYYESYISDVGDLSTFFGYREFDASGYWMTLGLCFPETISSWEVFRQMDAQKLLQQGYTDVKINNLPPEKHQLDIPLRLLSEGASSNQEIDLGQNPSLFLEKNGRKEYVVINGCLVKL